MTKSLLILFISLAFIKSYGQNLFLVNGEKEIHRLNSDNSLSLVATIDYSSNFITDIAISPDNIFYGITGDYKILEINIQDGSYIIINPNLNIDGGTYTGLVCSNENELYTLNGVNELYKYNITTGITSFIGNIGFNTPGDLTFYKGNLIFKDTDSATIKAYNIANNNVVDIFCLPAGGNNDFLGLSNIFDSCEENTIIGNANNSLFEIDFQNDEFVDLNIELNGMIIYGMASNNEYLSSTCDFQFEGRDCTMSIDELDWMESNKITYPNPINEIMYIDSKANLLTIEIFDLSGQTIKKISTTEKLINLSNMETGFYFVKITSKYGVRIEKIIKK